MTYRLAPSGMLDLGETSRTVGAVIFCDRITLDVLVRQAFDTNQHLSIHHKPEPEVSRLMYGSTGGMIFDTAIITAWTSGRGCVLIGFTIGRYTHSVLLDEIIEIQTFGVNGGSDRATSDFDR